MKADFYGALQLLAGFLPHGRNSDPRRWVVLEICFNLLEATLAHTVFGQDLCEVNILRWYLTESGNISQALQPFD